MRLRIRVVIWRPPQLSCGKSQDIPATYTELWVLRTHTIGFSVGTLRDLASVGWRAVASGSQLLPPEDPV